MNSCFWSRFLASSAAAAVACLLFCRRRLASAATAPALFFCSTSITTMLHRPLLYLLFENDRVRPAPVFWSIFGIHTPYAWWWDYFSCSWKENVDAGGPAVFIPVHYTLEKEIVYPLLDDKCEYMLVSKTDSLWGWCGRAHASATFKICTVHKLKSGKKRKNIF